jgi:hypothetical protein
MPDYSQMVNALMQMSQGNAMFQPVASPFDPNKQKLNPMAATEGARSYRGGRGRSYGGFAPADARSNYRLVHEDGSVEFFTNKTKAFKRLGEIKGKGTILQE